MAKLNDVSINASALFFHPWWKPKGGSASIGPSDMVMCEEMSLMFISFFRSIMVQILAESTFGGIQCYIFAPGGRGEGGDGGVGGMSPSSCSSDSC